MNLQEISGKQTQIGQSNSGSPYYLDVAAGDHIILIVGALLNHSAAGFEHPAIAARLRRVHEFKHYCRSGRKFWTSRPGLDFFFVVPKDRIQVIAEPGYSYPIVRINNHQFTLNVSASFGSGRAVDFIGNLVHTSVCSNRKLLSVIAGAALEPGQIPQALALNLKAVNDDYFRREHARVVLQGSVKPDMVLVLKGGYTIDGSHGPFLVTDRYKRHWYVSDSPGGYKTRVYTKHVDWLDTAKANQVDLPAYEDFNRAGTITEETP